MRKEIIEVVNNIQQNTRCYICYPQLFSKPMPFVLFIHGFRAFANWGFIPYMMEKIAENGFITGAIDFSLNEVIDYERGWFNMDKFRTNTITQQINEATILLDKLCLENWNGEVYLIGHSLGGGLAINVANNLSNKVRKLCTINSICDYDIYTAQQKKQWLNNGTKIFIGPTGQEIILNDTFLKDRLTYCGKRSILSTIASLDCALLLLHGDGDVTVSKERSKKLYDAALASKNNKEVKFEIIKHCNHLLNSQHPFEATNTVLDEVIEVIVRFMN